MSLNTPGSDTVIRVSIICYHQRWCKLSLLLYIPAYSLHSMLLRCWHGDTVPLAWHMYSTWSCHHGNSLPCLLGDHSMRRTHEQVLSFHPHWQNCRCLFDIEDIKIWMYVWILIYMQTYIYIWCIYTTLYKYDLFYHFTKQLTYLALFKR